MEVLPAQFHHNPARRAFGRRFDGVEIRFAVFRGARVDVNIEQNACLFSGEVEGQAVAGAPVLRAVEHARTGAPTVGGNVEIESQRTPAAAAA